MAKRETETGDYADMLERMIKAYGRRVGDADEPDLARMFEIVATLDMAVTEAVQGQRDGWRQASWASIASATGKTRQAAFQRWGTKNALPPEGKG